MPETTAPDVLFGENGDGVVAWIRGERVFRVYADGIYDLSVPAANTLPVPRHTRFSQRAVDWVARLLFEPLEADDAVPGTSDYAVRAFYLNDMARFEPMDGDHEATPAIVTAGLAVHAYLDLDPDEKRYVVGIHFDDVPAWMLDGDGNVPITIHMNGQTIPIPD